MTHDVFNGEPSVAKINAVDIVYDTFGNPGNPTLLLIMGLGCQMID